MFTYIQKFILQSKIGTLKARALISIIIVAVCFSSGNIEGDRPLLVINARIYTMGPDGILEGGMMLIENGKITKIGSRIDLTPNTEVLDLSNRTIIPGLVCADSFVGIPFLDAWKHEQESPESLALDSFDRYDAAAYQAAQNGVTTLYVFRPGFEKTGGLGAVIKISPHAPLTFEVINKEAALNLTLDRQPGERTSNEQRLNQYYQLRELFNEAVKYRDKKTEAGESGNKEQKEPFLEDEGKEILIRAMQGDIPVRIEVHTSDSIQHALNLAKEFSLRIIMRKADEWPQALNFLAASGVPLLVDLFSDYYQDLLPGGLHGYAASILQWNGDNFPNEQGDQEILKRNWDDLLRHMIPFALIPPHGSIYDVKNLRYYASILVAEGVPPLEALRAVTIAPAEILGISKRVGSLEVGKDADFVVLDGDALDTLSKIELVFAGGHGWSNQAK